MQNWVPLGRIIESQAQLPTVLALPDRWRVYFSHRDYKNRSKPYCIDVEIGNPSNILAEHVVKLPLGPLGSFDHFGIMPSCSRVINGKIYLYYVGWSLRKDVPYHNLTGLAVSDDGITFDKIGPVRATDLDNPYFTGTATVIDQIDHRGYDMYHMSCTEWIEGNPPEPKYHLKRAVSKDGIIWKHHSVAVDFKDNQEGGISGATIYLAGQDPVYYMWYSYRNLIGYRDNPQNSYKIGCATSLDRGASWIRCDQAVKLPRSDWDKQMQCYPAVIKDKDFLWMFYNGNGFGQTGIGVARLSLLS